MGASTQEGNLAKTGTAPTGKPQPGSLDTADLGGSSASAASGLDDLAMHEGIGPADLTAFEGKYLSPEAFKRLLIRDTGAQPEEEKETTQHSADFAIKFLSRARGISQSEAARWVADELAHSPSRQAHLPQLEEAKKDLGLGQDATLLRAGRDRQMQTKFPAATGTMSKLIEDFVTHGIGDRLTPGTEIHTVEIPAWVEVSLTSSALMRSITTAAAWVAYRAKQAFHLATSGAGLVAITAGLVARLAALASVTGSQLPMFAALTTLTFGMLARAIYCLESWVPFWGSKWQEVNRPEPNLLTKGEVDLSKGSKNSSAVTKLLEFCKAAGITVHQSVDRDGTRTWSFHA